MLVSLVLGLDCPACRIRNEGVTVRQIRINKGSLRTVPGDIGLGFVPRSCKECSTTLGSTVDSTRLSDEDLVKVNEWRARKGWEPIKPSAGVAS